MMSEERMDPQIRFEELVHMIGKPVYVIARDGIPVRGPDEGWYILWKVEYACNHRYRIGLFGSSDCFLDQILLFREEPKK